MRKYLIVFLAALFLGSFVCRAQSVQNSAAPSMLTLEITFHKDRKPAYQLIGENDKLKKGSWFALFETLPDWRQPESALPVRAVNIVPTMENGLVKVRVSVFLGKKYHEKEEFVAEYRMREDEKVSVEELKKFGVAPFEIAVVRLVQTASVLPRVINKSESVTVVGLEPVSSAVPSYKLILANNSENAVSAISFRVTVDDSLRLSGIPQGAGGRPLIEPGKMLEKEIPNATKLVKVAPGQPIPVETNQTLTIAAVIFEDDSFEGEALEAARFLSFKFGRKVQLERIVELLGQAVESKTALSELESRAENLGVEIDDNNFNSFTAKFADLPEKEKFSLRNAINTAMQSVKRDFISDVKNLAESRENSKTSDLRNWLKISRQKYQDWLLRLK